MGKKSERGDSEGKRTRTQRGKGTRKGGNGVGGFLGGESYQQPLSRGGQPGTDSPRGLGTELCEWVPTRLKSSFALAPTPAGDISRKIAEKI